MEGIQFEDLREKEVTIGGKTLVMREMAGKSREKYDAFVSLMTPYELRIADAQTIEEAEKAADDLAKLRLRIMKSWFPDEEADWLESQRTKERFVELLLEQTILNRDEELSKKMRSRAPVL